VPHGSVIAEFAAISTQFTDGDTLVVMFAGHGVQDEHDNFKGWALSGDDTFSPDDLEEQYESYYAKYPKARWIVLSDCCYGDGITEGASAYGVLQRCLAAFYTKVLRRDTKQHRYKRLAESAVTTLQRTAGKGAPANMISIAAAAADEIVSDGGQLLFATMLVGSSIGQRTYQELDDSFGLVNVQTHAFKCHFATARSGDLVLT